MPKFKSAAALAGVLALAAIGLTGQASASPPAATAEVTLIGDVNGGLHFSQTTIAAGNVRFYESTHAAAGLDVTLIKLKPGRSLPEFGAALNEEFSQNPKTAAKGTRDLVQIVDVYGLADTVKGFPLNVIERLSVGTYYAFNSSGSGIPRPTALHVVPVMAPNAVVTPPALPTVTVTSDDRFVVSGQLKAHGAFTLRNVSDTIHFADLEPVKPGTTDAQVQAFFNSGAQGNPSFAMNGPGFGVDVTSPGVALVLSYWVPRGTYVLLCFVADDQTGMPHAFMGMHKVVTLN